LAETHEALIFDLSRKFSSLAGLGLPSRSPMVWLSRWCTLTR